MTDESVSICIPAFEAEAFIARTLECAQAQTHRDIRILVSIDQSADATAAICRAAAASDPRIEIIEQTARLGWSQNANVLLRAVRTPYFFFYFHDDIITPDYVERLLSLLRASPGAMSAHAQLERFGGAAYIQKSTSYEGAAFDRLLLFLREDNMGLILRSLMRSEAIARGLAFPTIGGDGNWRAFPFMIRMLALGPALYEPAPLYRRWIRPGSLVGAWAPKIAQDLIIGQSACAAECLRIAAELDAPEEQKDILRIALGLRIMLRTRGDETKLSLDTPIAPVSIAPAFADLTPPDSMSALSPQQRTDVLRLYGEWLTVDGRDALRRKDFRAALTRLSAAAALRPNDWKLLRDLSKALSRRGDKLAGRALALRAAQLRDKSG